jgi:hypothetical protein
VHEHTDTRGETPAIDPLNLAGATTMPKGAPLITGAIGAWAVVLIVFTLRAVPLWAPTRMLRRDADAQLRVLLMLIILALAFRWASQAATAGGISDRAACMVRCGALGGTQAAYSDADGVHCICRYP